MEYVSHVRRVSRCKLIMYGFERDAVYNAYLMQNTYFADWYVFVVHSSFLNEDHLYAVQSACRYCSKEIYWSAKSKENGWEKYIWPIM